MEQSGLYIGIDILIFIFLYEPHLLSLKLRRSNGLLKYPCLFTLTEKSHKQTMIKKKLLYKF